MLEQHLVVGPKSFVKQHTALFPEIAVAFVFRKLRSMFRNHFANLFANY